MGRGDEKWEMRRHKKTDSLERPSALDNKNLNSFYRIIEIILIIANPIIAKFQRNLSDTANKPAVIDDYT